LTDSVEAISFSSSGGSKKKRKEPEGGAAAAPKEPKVCVCVGGVLWWQGAFSGQC
jgi:hypothetical protein